MPRIYLVGALVAVICSIPLSTHAQTDSTTTSETQTTTINSSIPFDPFDSTQVEAKVRASFADIPVMIKIAKCESDFTQFDSTGHPLYGGTGGMVGVFQVAAAIHNNAAKELGFNINSLDGNLAYARTLYENEGTVPWLASAHCWNPIPLLRALTVGSTGKQVLLLQQILNRNGYLVAINGEGSLGQESSIFGPMTREAVKKFQCDKRIACSGSEKTTGYGMVGVKTRIALLKIDAKNAQTKGITNLSKK